jgi:hypothetical protein
MVLLLATIWLFKRRRRSGRQAGMVCLVMSVALHLALLFLVPLLPMFDDGDGGADSQTNPGTGFAAVSFSTFDPDTSLDDTSQETMSIGPLPIADLTAALQQPSEQPQPSPTVSAESVVTELPSALAEPTLRAESPGEPPSGEHLAGAPIESALDEMLSDVFSASVGPVAADRSDPAAVEEPDLDFVNRTGTAKQRALLSTGGDATTEAAVAAAIRYLATAQRADGAWDTQSSGAGIERSPLGLTRPGAGQQAHSAITGLALLSLMGAGHTHQQGDYSDHVYRGLVYLMRVQKLDGSLAGDASVYESTYCHGMAALAICEAAAMTQDPAALRTAARAIDYTRRMQHPTTGGWRYTQGDPGDLSQLGWQAMVLDAGNRAGLPIHSASVRGVSRFLDSVRLGSQGGLASYRPGERVSPTMTAEALATRLLLGQVVPPSQIAEAESYLLQHPPGTGQDNYYYWYYATLALHQLQDDAWHQWNAALKQRLLETQRSDGSWPTDSLWGGYGGTIYTTSMAALCLETYYRHAIRSNANPLARQADAQPSLR